MIKTTQQAQRSKLKKNSINVTLLTTCLDSWEIVIRKFIDNIRNTSNFSFLLPFIEGSVLKRLFEVHDNSLGMESCSCVQCHLLNFVWLKCFIVTLTEPCYRLGWLINSKRTVTRFNVLPLVAYFEYVLPYKSTCNCN